MASKIREILKILGIWRKENPYVFTLHYNKISVFSCIIFHAFKSKFNICIIESHFYFCNAEVAKLADAPDLGSGAARHGGSSPLFRTTILKN